MATLPIRQNRKFQSTGFGGDRCSNDPLPKWKRKIHEKMRKQSRQNRNELLKRLRSERSNNKQSSPNTKLKNAETLITHFKNEVIRREIATYHKSEQSNTFNTIPQEMPPEMSLSIAEMEKWLERELLSEIRTIEASEIEAEELLHTDKKIDELVESGLIDDENDPYSIICPFCQRSDLSIEFITNVGVFNCEKCGIQFQSSNPNLRYANKTEKDFNFARRLLKTTKDRITHLYNAHYTNKQCFHPLIFRIVPKSRTVELHCQQCAFCDCI